MIKITSVEHHIDDCNVLNITFDSEKTLVDSDVVVMDPLDLNRFWKHATPMYDGSFLLSLEKGAENVRYMFERRKNEICQLLQGGKIIIIFLRPTNYVMGEKRSNVDVLFRALEHKKNQELITNYDWLPLDLNALCRFLIEGEGSTLILKNSQHHMVPYFRAFKEKILYYVYLKNMEKKLEFITDFLHNRSGNPIGFSLRIGKGLVSFVPPPPENVDPKKLVNVIVQCTRHIITGDLRTPEPNWAKKFIIPGEKRLVSKIQEINEEIEKLQNEVNNLQEEKESLSNYRGLLYEKGKPLENIAMKSFQLLGFNAQNFQRDDMEHDIVLDSSEGRAIVEVEGRDKEAIHIEKLDQLTRVIDEDFLDHDTHAVGILLGNPYRLKPTQERKEPFTEKVLLAVGRKQFSLLTTEELFRVINLVLENPINEDLKKACREIILNSPGKEISFTTIINSLHKNLA